MKEQGFFNLPSIFDLKAITEQNNIALKKVFKGRIKGNFLIDVKDQIMEALGFDDLIKYYDFSWSEEKSLTGIGVAAEYDICRIIVGIHKAKSIFLSVNDIRRNEKKIIRETFLLLCKEKEVEPMIDGQDIISMLDRDFEILYDQYLKRSTDNFNRYYNISS